MSELFGRQYLFIGTYAGLTAFNAGAAGAQNIWSLIIMRFFAGAIGSSPLTNAGGVIADMFSAKERGLAMSLFAAAPFMGPVLGPIVGGFVGETVGWRWVEGVMAIFTGILWIIGSFLIPESYPPVILRQRAKELSRRTGKVYKTRGDIDQGETSAIEVFKTSLSRPWILLFQEPIVLLLSIYMAIIYGTLYMCFGAFPIVYQQGRGWSPGIGGLAFLGVAVGMLIAVAYSIWDNKRYAAISDKFDGFAPPEARLPLCMVGSVAVPIGLFWFAWTNYPSIHWIVSIMAGAPFGFGMVLIFLGIMNYLIDSYTIFAASVLAANSVLRSLFGAAFPLFTTQMYDGLGIHWASSIPAFLALVCVPFPFLFYKCTYCHPFQCKVYSLTPKQMVDRSARSANTPPKARNSCVKCNSKCAATRAPPHPLTTKPRKRRKKTPSSPKTARKQSPSDQRSETQASKKRRKSSEGNPSSLLRMLVEEMNRDSLLPLGLPIPGIQQRSLIIITVRSISTGLTRGSRSRLLGGVGLLVGRALGVGSDWWSVSEYDMI
jgi:MFS family permease